jgi:hypothetical protein
MADITDADAIVEESQEPKVEEKRDLADICKRYMESQKELMEVVVALLVRLEKIEGALNSPLLK